MKRKADQLAPSTHISVFPKSTQEEFGTFLFNNTDSLTFHDIDRNTDVTLRYEDVKKIKNGYGGKNYANHRHVDRERNLIVAAVVAGVLIAVIAAAAAAR